MYLRRLTAALAAAMSLLGCDTLGRRDVPAVFISETLGICPSAGAAGAALPACDPLLPSVRDSLVLREAIGETRPDADALSEATGIGWTAGTRPEEGLHVRFAASPEQRTSYVLELLRSDLARDTVLAIASNGGTVVWHDGVLLGASRFAARRARAHQDLYSVHLHPGVNRLLYRVITQTAESQLHRSWHGTGSLPDLLEASIALGAYTGMAVTPILADTAHHVQLLRRQVRLDGYPAIRLRWLGLLGEARQDAGTYRGSYPERLPLPRTFAGMAVLETEVADPATGRVLYYEQQPIFSTGAAARLARQLTSRAVSSADPVRVARVAAVRAAFALGRDTIPLTAWHQAHTLADLYRRDHLPQRFHRFPGPQVWGYRAADGTIQPYWLVVPPGGATQPDARLETAPGLEFSVTHMIHPSFWRGRGYTVSWLDHLSALSGTTGNFAVLPHLRGRHDFGRLGIEEFSTITRQLAAAFTIDTSRVAWLVWSSHARRALEIARDPSVPLAVLGIAVPALQRDLRTFEQDLDSLRAVRPGLEWVMWRAADDDQVPRDRTQAWLKAIRNAGFRAEYRELPYSTHLGGFFEDIEAELFWKVAPGRQRSRRD